MARVGKSVVVVDESVKPQAEQKASVTFIKNRTNELVVLPDGKTFKFSKSSFSTSDESLIESLKSVANKYGIFIAE